VKASTKFKATAQQNTDLTTNSQNRIGTGIRIGAGMEIKLCIHYCILIFKYLKEVYLFVRWKMGFEMDKKLERPLRCKYCEKSLKIPL
jgi:hypothetical protein